MNQRNAPAAEPPALDPATLDRIAAFYGRVWNDPGAERYFDTVFPDLAAAFGSLLGAGEVTIWIPQADPDGAADNGAGLFCPAYTTLAAEQAACLTQPVDLSDPHVATALSAGHPVAKGATGCEAPSECGGGSLVIPVTPYEPQLRGEIGGRHNLLMLIETRGPADEVQRRPPPETLTFFARIAGKQVERALWREQDVVVHEAFEALDTLQSDRYRALDAVAEAVRRSLHFEACTILQADASRRVLTVLGTTGIDSRMSRRKMEYPFGFSLSGTIAVERRTFAVQDTRQNDRWGATRLFPDVVESADRYQYLGAPMLSNAGELLGVIRLRNKRAISGQSLPKLNALDRVRIERVAKVISPLMALMIRETEMSGAMKRIQHDIDMPATAIRDGAGVLRRRVESRLTNELANLRQRPENTDAVTRLTSEVDVIRQKLEDIESFGEILLVNSVLMGIFDAEELPICPQQVLLVRDAVAKLCKMLTPLAREKQLSGILYNQHSLFAIPALWLDARLIEIALYNLLQNALKYSNPDTVVVIDGEIARIEGRNWYAVHVKNHGIGVGDDDAPRIFQRYYRGPKARKRSVTGLGIGLSTARSIVERHGGRLLLTQRDNPTIFSMLLPESLASRKPE